MKNPFGGVVGPPTSALVQVRHEHQAGGGQPGTYCGRAPPAQQAHRGHHEPRRPDRAIRECGKPGHLRDRPAAVQQKPAELVAPAISTTGAITLTIAARSTPTCAGAMPTPAPDIPRRQRRECARIRGQRHRRWGQPHHSGSLTHTVNVCGQSTNGVSTQPDEACRAGLGVGAPVGGSRPWPACRSGV